jgi:glyoxylase I family protein
MPIVRVHHIAVICADFDRSRRFYHEILGFPIVRETYRAERRSHKCDLRIPSRDPASDVQIELFSFPDPPPRPSYPEARGLRHLALAVTNLDGEVTRLTSLGVACEPIRVDPATSCRFTFFADPDGLPIELYEVD